MTMDSNRGGPMLTAARLWRKTSTKGTDYLVGRLGGVRVLVMPKREGDHSHALLFTDAALREGGGCGG